MKILLSLLVASLFVGFANEGVHRFEFTSIDGKQVSLSQFKGKKILIVNTASKCGYTKQYAGLQELSEKYGKNLVVIGFPSGNFREQEFESNDEILEFCEENYGVTFLLSEKTEVKGDAISPLFDYLTSAENPDFKGDINWNFEKFLIDENGKLVHRFRSKVEPLSEELTSKL
jgi:glutathione peroxidase